MAVDATPTPPDHSQGLPDRPLPFAPVPGMVQFAKCAPQEGQPDLVAFIYDSPEVRVVSYWAEDAFVQLAQRMLAFVGAGPGLTVADMDDLQKLKDAGPFLEKP